METGQSGSGLIGGKLGPLGDLLLPGPGELTISVFLIASDSIRTTAWVTTGMRSASDQGLLKRIAATPAHLAERPRVEAPHHRRLLGFRDAMQVRVNH